MAFNPFNYESYMPMPSIGGGYPAGSADLAKLIARQAMEQATKERGGGRFDLPPAPTGSLAGQPSSAGSPATGYIPYVPDPSATSAKALATNLANIPALHGLFSGIANTYIPGATAKFAQESANVDELLNPTKFVDTDRYSAEAGAARGIAGSPAAISSAVLRRDKDKLQRQLLGSQLLSSIASRGAGMLPIPQFLITPESQQQWQYLANQLAAAPNPAEAYNLAGANAARGLQAGMRAGYGGGGGAPSPTAFFNPGSSQPMSNADRVVSKYAGSLGMTPPQTGNGGGGWGFATGEGGSFGIAPETRFPMETPDVPGTILMDRGGNISWPEAQPLPAEAYPSYQQPPEQQFPRQFSVMPPEIDYDWTL